MPIWDQNDDVKMAGRGWCVLEFLKVLGVPLLKLVINLGNNYPTLLSSPIGLAIWRRKSPIH